MTNHDNRGRHRAAGTATIGFDNRIEPRNAFGLAAIVLGVIGMLFGLVPFTGFVAVALGLAGVVFALANRGRLRRGAATNRKTTWAGLVTSVVAIGLGVWGMTIVFDAVKELDRDFQELERELEDWG